MLEVRHVSKSFAAARAVRDISFAARPGEIVGLVGRNGAGKSTLMRLIAGVLAPDSGTIALKGAPRLGFLPEGAPLYGELSPRDALDFVLGAHGLDRAQRRQRIQKTLATLALETVAGQPCETLSKGFARRTALAMALAPEPDVLILDEPFDGFDPVQKHAASTHLKALGENRLILVSTHSLNDARRLCSRLIVIEQGRLCADAAPGALLRQSGTQSLEEAFRALLAGAGLAGAA